MRVTKGAVSRYIVKEIGIGIARRDGELIVNSTVPEEVTWISFATADINGKTTKPTGIGDLIEFVEAASGRESGDTTRYQVMSGESSALTVEYLSGTNNFAVGEPEEVFVYPQNKVGASKEYVDAQDDLLYPKTGGSITGAIRSKVPNQSTTANFEILASDASRSYLLWNPNGAGQPVKQVLGNNNDLIITNASGQGVVNTSAKFGHKYLTLYGGRYTPQGGQEKAVAHTIDTKHTFDGRVIFEPAAANHNGFTIKGKSNSQDDSLLGVYHNGGGSTLDAINYGGKTSSDTNIQTKTSVEALIAETGVTMETGTSTNPTLSSGEMYWNTSKKVLYIGD